MSWGAAGMRSLLIVAYFVFATVWLPSKVARLELLGDQGATVQGIAATAVWVATLSAGMWALRSAQRRHRI